MRKIPPIFGLIACLFYSSCQKELTNPSPDDPPSVDTAGQFRLKTIWEYSYDAPGVFADSSRVDFTYDSIARTLSFKSVFWDTQLNDLDSSRNTFRYNANGDWMEEEEYSAGLTSIAWTNRFTRNASGQATQFNYTRNNGTPKNYTAFFQYQPLAGGGQRVKVIDTAYLDYSIANYYQADIDALGLVQKIEFLPWSIYDGNVIHYSYSSNGQMQKIVDSSFNAFGDGYVVVTDYVQDVTVNKVLDGFVKNCKGKNFWWYMQDKYYNFNLFYDNYYVGTPLQEFNVKEQQFQGGVLVNQTEIKYTLQNTVDANKNLIETLFLYNGILLARRKFAYQKK
ncbi:MAG: hypothetical protein ACKVOW_17495 [Chitinophagaceae bacterium]